MTSNIECTDCKEPLTPEVQRQGAPCPKCGSSNRTVYMTGISISTTVGWAIPTQRHGHTGREVTGASAVSYARQWARLADRESMLGHPAADKFQQYLDSAKCLDCHRITLYRGQGIDEPESVPPSVERMGPLPSHLFPREGRYHRAGKRALYLTSSEDGSRREMAAWHTGGLPYFIRIDLPLTSLRIADFTDWPSDHFVTAVFEQAELCCLRERGGPEDYTFSQVIGELVSTHFDGMMVPGVRGEPGAHYSNVVLFQRLEEWSKWIATGSGPYLLEAEGCN